MKQSIKLLYLYPYEMNTYGDWGNVLCLLQRIKRRKINVELIEYRPGDSWPKNIDLIFMGGGQDSGQGLILEDLKKIGPKIKQLVESGVPSLTICGAYQLFGHYFLTHDKVRLDGLGIFDCYTEAQSDRLIGNQIVDSSQFGKLVGFENHSGRTYLGDLKQALGKVKFSGGNNNQDKTEGIIYQHSVGTYLHGPILPKNPALADWLIAAALNINPSQLPILPDPYVAQARKQALSRPR